MGKEFGLESGCVYLIDSEELEKSYEIFSDMVKKGYRGLCITRRSPEKIRSLYGLSNTPILWLSENNTTENTNIGPKEYFKLHPIIDDFVNSEDRGLILFDGLEYLILENDFNNVVKFVEMTNDSIMASNSKALLQIDPYVFDPKEYHLLKRWMRYLPEMRSKEKADIS